MSILQNKNPCKYSNHCFWWWWQCTTLCRVFDQTDVSAGLAASILHDRETTVQSIKEVIRQGYSSKMTNYKIDFSKGLVPAILQDNQTKQVLMLGYMNQEAFDKTIEDGVVCFYSRSKQRLWTKGETSGHTQRVKDIHVDCDNDTILMMSYQMDQHVIQAVKVVSTQSSIFSANISADSSR